MDLPSKEDFEALMGEHEGPCVSIYLSTFHAGTDLAQNPIRFRNLLRIAEEQLEAKGVRPTEARAMLKPATEVLHDALIWERFEEGLAVFISEGFSSIRRLPFPFPEMVVVNKRFHIKPMLPLLNTGGRFHVLALSLSQVRLLECTPFEFRTVELEGMPTCIDDTVQYDALERSMQFHTSGNAVRGRNPVMYHGQGGGADETRHKNDILRYVQEVDKGLQHQLHGDPAPMVFAGVNYLHAIYVEATARRNLIDKPILGNPETMSNEELHDKAWPLARPMFRGAQSRAQTQIEQLRGTDRVTHDIRTIVPAAIDGRIESLFVALDKHITGSFDAASGQFTTGAVEKNGGAEDLLDYAAAQTILHGGNAYALSSDEIPDKSPCAAILRYVLASPRGKAAR